MIFLNLLSLFFSFRVHPLDGLSFFTSFSYQVGDRVAMDMFPKNKLYAFFQTILFLIFLTYCGKTQEEEKQPKAEKSPDNRPPIIKLAKIQPNAPNVDKDLGVVVDKAFDPDGDPVEYLFQWLIDDREIPRATGKTLSRDMLQKDQEIRCIIIPTDGKTKGKPFVTKSVWIRNSLPVIDEIDIKPTQLFPGDTAEVVVQAHDQDQDPISVLAEWYVNDVSIQKGGMRLSLAKFRKKDRLFVKVAAQDEEGQGPWFKSKIVTIQNSPPRILSKPPATWSLKQGFQYRVEAEDPDGDPIHIHIEGKIPPGMVWNEKALTLTWKPPKDTKGSFKLKAIAEDNDGGVFTQEFTLTLS